MARDGIPTMGASVERSVSSRAEANARLFSESLVPGLAFSIGLPSFLPLALAACNPALVR